jgi:glycogen synthase
MKVLMLGWELPPNYVGGMGVVCDQLTKQLAKDGADIEFVLPFHADYSATTHMRVVSAIDQDATTLMLSGGTYDSMKYQVTSTGGPTKGQKFVRSLSDQVEAFAHNVGRIVEYGKYDVIHVHDWLTLRAGLVAKQITDLPLFVHIHATEFDRAGGNYGNPLIRDIEYVGLHMADHIFAVSNLTKNILMREYGLPADKITVTYNVMDISKEHMAEQEDSYKCVRLLKENGYNVVMNAGRITVQKGLTYLLDAAKLVIDKNPKTIFLFVGGGEQIPELLVKSADLGIARNVMFTGRVEGIGKQWRDSFRVADLYVMPSVSEPAGMVPLEAICYGAPVLLSKQSGIAEFLVNALKVDHWDTTNMASQILSVLNNKALHDDLLINSQAEHAKLTWGETSGKIMKQYALQADNKNGANI